MPPHRDWTRHGVGRALLWWPLVAFIVVAAFPALAVPGVIVSGACLVVVGIVGGAIGRQRRARRVREARRTVTAFAPRRVREAMAASTATATATASRTESGGDDDAEDDLQGDLGRHAA